MVRVCKSKCLASTAYRLWTIDHWLHIMVRFFSAIIIICCLSTLQRLGPSGGILGRVNVNPRVSFKVSANYANVGYDDALTNNEFQQARNLSFQSNIFEGVGQVEFNFLPFISSEYDKCRFAAAWHRRARQKWRIHTHTRHVRIWWWVQIRAQLCVEYQHRSKCATPVYGLSRRCQHDLHRPARPRRPAWSTCRSIGRPFVGSRRSTYRWYRQTTRRSSEQWCLCQSWHQPCISYRGY